jgi:hypothetical protein
MTEPTLESLARRLERVERGIRRWRVIGSAALVTLAFLVLLGATGQKVEDEVRAKSFVLVDQQGRQRAVLNVVPLPFFDIAGLKLYDQKGRARAALAVAGDGSSALNLYDQANFTQVNLSADPDGTPHLNLFGRNRQLLWQAP